jgi:hypothetical protein
MRNEIRLAMMMMLLCVPFFRYGQVQNAAPDPWVDYASAEDGIFPTITYSTAILPI